ncbi:MAG: energy transducer TonB family protein [Wolinella sp.]
MKTSKSLPNKNSSSFWIGFGSSCLVHALIIGGFYLYPAQKELVSQSQRALIPLKMGQFQPPKSQESTSPEPMPPKKEPKKRVAKKIPVPIPKEEILKEEPKEEPKQEELEPIASEPEVPSSENITEDTSDAPFSEEVLATFDKDREFLARIHAAIAKYKKYPRQAQRMKMQGEVMVEFGLTKEGKIAWINIIQSSKHELLDEHALETIKKAASEFPPPKRSVRIKVPIAYYLT